MKQEATPKILILTV